MIDIKRIQSEKGSKMKLPDEVCLTELARFFSKDIRTLKIRMGAIKPARKNGRYTLYSTLEALEAILTYDHKKETPDELDIDLTKAKVRHLLATTKKVEVETEILKGELVDGEEFERLYAEKLENLKSILLQMPRQVSRDLSAIDDHLKVEAYIETDLKDRLNRFAQQSQGDNA